MNGVIVRENTPSRARLAWLNANPAIPCVIAGALLIAVPALFYAPILPYPDILGFTAMNSFPARSSYGPEHHYLFQFTYILPHILSRIMTLLGVAQKIQALFYYFLQALSLYGVTSYLLFRMVRN